MKALYTSLMIGLATAALAQMPVLHPSLGLASLPAASDAICTVPQVSNNFENNGPEVGDTATDFTLYSINGTTYNLGSRLAAGRPVLMVAGSFTCPVFREKVAMINAVALQYGSMLDVVIIYTIEAHPFTDVSPYSGQVNPTQQNIDLSILYDQPTTYGQRLAVAQDMFAQGSVDPAMVYFDGPCNPWWYTYGPAPNNSYLIDTTGIIVSKHGWFDRYPDNIMCDLQHYFGEPETACNVATDGEMVVDLLNTLVSGPAGSTLYSTAEIINTSASTLRVTVTRILEELPTDWTSSMCITACLADWVSVDTVLIAPNDTQTFSIDFHTGALPDSGRVRIGFRNTDNLSQDVAQWFRAFTVPVAVANLDLQQFVAYPNPTTGRFKADFPAGMQGGTATVTDLMGRALLQQTFRGNRLELDLSGHAPGLYSVRVQGADGLLMHGKVVVE